MKQIALLNLVVSLAVSGCISSSSVHPILTDDDLSHDVDLVGMWRQVDLDKDQGEHQPFTLEGWDDNARYDMTLTFSKSEQETRSERRQKGYPVIPAEYDVTVGKIDDILLLQARRSELITGGPSFFEGVVTYTFARFELKDDVLLVYTINDQALETLLPKTTMSHFMHKPSDWARNIVITESTKRVQQFLKEYHETIFHSKPLKLQRVTSKSDAQAIAPESPATSTSNSTSTPAAR
jgi:hypothetical protein